MTKTHEEQADEFVEMFEKQIIETFGVTITSSFKVLATQNAIILVDKLYNNSFKFSTINDTVDEIIKLEIEDLTAVKAILEQRINK